MQTAAATSLNKNLSVSQTLQAACENHPALAPLIDHFSALYTTRAELIEGLADKLAHDKNCPPPSISKKRLQHGVALLSESDLSWAVHYYPEIEADIFPYLEDIGSLRPHVTKFREACSLGTLSLEKLLNAVLHSNESELLGSAEKSDIPPESLLFITQQILSCALGAYVIVHKEVLSDLFWREGYCPVCGSFPDISTLQRPDADQSEFLAGGGGKKMMHCSVCAHEWHFRRGTCPACNNDEAGAIHYFHVEDRPAERVEYCEKCSSYLNNIDLRNTTATPELSAAPLTLLHLDMQAAQNKLVPLTRNIWNTF